MGVLRRGAKHLRILGHYARLGVLRKSQLRVEFWSQVAMDTLWYLSHVTVFEVLMSHADHLAGWTRDEIRVFLGFLFISDAFMMMWLGQAWHFSKDLKDGNLDAVRVRPASPIVVYYFRSFSLEAGFNLLLGFSWLLYALWRAGVPPTLATGARLLWAVALTWWIQVVLMVLFTIIEFYVVNSDLSHFFRDFFHAVEDRPLDIFTRRIRVFFLCVVPVGAMAHVPAALVLGKWDATVALAATAWVLLLGQIVFASWRLSFRRYESAMS